MKTRLVSALVLLVLLLASVPAAAAPSPSPSADAAQVKKWDERHVVQWEKVLTQVNRRQVTREKALGTATRWMERHQVADVQARTQKVRSLLDLAYKLDQAAFEAKKTALATRLFAIIGEGFERPTGTSGGGKKSKD